MVDPLSAIAGALIAGATAAFKDTATQAVKDAYNGLRTVIIDVYKLTSLSILEQDPTEASYQGTVRTQVGKTPQIAEDPKVRDAYEKLAKALSEEPTEKIESWGLIAKDVKALSDVTFERISGEHGGANLGNVISEQGNVKFSDIHGGKNSGN